MEPVPDPLLLRKSGSAGNGTQTSGSVARNSDNYTTEAVFQLYYVLHNVLAGCYLRDSMVSQSMRLNTESIIKELYSDINEGKICYIVPLHVFRHFNIKNAKVKEV
jgi:hypothetical protein